MNSRRQIGRALVDAHAIRERIASLAEEIVRDQPPSDRPLVVVIVLTGALVFGADLIRALPHRMKIALVKVTSYPGTATTSQGIMASGPMPEALHGCDVLIVDDVLDTGRTIAHMRREITAAGAKSVRCCVFLRKDRPDAFSTPCEHVGFDIPDAYVVGYGLDFDGEFRNLPDIREFIEHIE